MALGTSAAPAGRPRVRGRTEWADVGPGRTRLGQTPGATLGGQRSCGLRFRMLHPRSRGPDVIRMHSTPLRSGGSRQPLEPPNSASPAKPGGGRLGLDPPYPMAGRDRPREAARSSQSLPTIGIRVLVASARPTPVGPATVGPATNEPVEPRDGQRRTTSQAIWEGGWLLNRL